MEKQSNKNGLTKRNTVLLLLVIAVIVCLQLALNNDSKISMQPRMMGATPLKVGTKIATREESQEHIFSMLTLELGGNFNPIHASTEGEHMVNELVFQPLAYQDGNDALYPVLAESIEYDDDLSMTIAIKEEIYFSDGTRLDSKDVVESLLIFALMGHPSTEMIVGIEQFLLSPERYPEGIEIIDDHTFTIQFSTYELQNESLLTLPIQKVPPILWGSSELLEDLDVLLMDGIGTNRYVLSWKSPEGVQLTQNPHYVARTVGESTQIETVNIYDASKIDAAQAVTSELIDYYTFAHDSTLLDTIVNQEILDIYGKDTPNIVTLIANSESKTAMNEALRGTMVYTINRDALFDGDLLYQMVAESTILPTAMAREMTERPTAESNINTQQAASFIYIAQTELADEMNTVTTETETGIVVEEVPVVQDGNVVVRIPILKDNAYHKAIGMALQEQLLPEGIAIQLDAYTEYEYADVVYFTKEYDFQIVELKRLETIHEIDQFFYQYAIGETKEMANALNALRTEGIHTPASVYDDLHRLATHHTRVIPLGGIQDLTAVSTYWHEMILTEMTHTPLYVYAE